MAAFLPPETDDEDEGLCDFKLAQRVAEVHGGAVLGELGVHRHPAVFPVCFGGDVPALGVAGRLVALEEGVAHPLLEHEAVALHLLGRGDQGQQEKQEEPPHFSKKAPRASSFSDQ